jgi:hypothetical protein
MENASKALIIAGAILISILIIAIGMFIYSQSSASISSGMSQLSAQEIDAFNNQWESYKDSQKGSNISALIGKLISNASTNKKNAEKLVGVQTVNWGTDASKSTSTGGIVLSEADLKTTELTALKKEIVSNHTYNVQFEYDGDSGLINKVVITY